MPYDIYWEPRGAEVRFYGECTGRTVAKALHELHGYAHFDDLRGVLYDTSRCTSLIYEGDDPELAAASDLGAGLSNPHICVAVVATQVDAIRYFDAYMGSQISPYPMRVFTDREHGRGWLDEMARKHKLGHGRPSVKRHSS